MTKNSADTKRVVGEGTSERSIYEAFLNVCAGVTNVKRSATGQVGQQKYKYATLDQVLDMVNPLLEENGLALVQYVDEDTLRALLVHRSGEKLPLGGYNLGPIDKHQARGSAITYGRRYQICAIFGITQEDDDGAAASQPKQTAKSGVFPTKTARKEFEDRLTKQMENCPDLGELKAIWDEAYPVLHELRQSDNEDDQHSYAHLLKLKDMAKIAINTMSPRIDYEDTYPHGKD